MSAVIGVLLEAKVVQQELVIAPIGFYLYPALQIDAAAQKLFAVCTGSTGNFFQHCTAFSNDHALVAFALAVDIYINIDQVGARALFEALHHNSNAMGDLVAHEQQGLFTDDLRHKLLFRHIRVGIIIK